MNDHMVRANHCHCCRLLQSPPVVPQLCQSLMDAAGAAAGTAAAAAADAIVDALAALVHAAANNSNAANMADHFPLAQMLTAKLTDPTDHGVDGDTSLLEVRVWIRGWDWELEWCLQDADYTSYLSWRQHCHRFCTSLLIEAAFEQGSEPVLDTAALCCVSLLHVLHCCAAVCAVLCVAVCACSSRHQPGSFAGVCEGTAGPLRTAGRGCSAGENNQLVLPVVHSPASCVGFAWRNGCHCSVDALQGCLVAAGARLQSVSIVAAALAHRLRACRAVFLGDSQLPGCASPARGSRSTLR
jgi:hypothetical protein